MSSGSIPLRKSEIADKECSTVMISGGACFWRDGESGGSFPVLPFSTEVSSIL